MSHGTPTKSRFLFDHIYKAAGSSLGELFIERFGTDNVTPGLVEPLRNALVRYAEKAVITGHFSFMPGERLDPTRYSLTLLRHPVDRLLSHYYFARHQVAQRGGNPAIDIAKQLSLDEYIECGVPEVVALLSNDQTAHFMPMRWDGSTKLGPQQQLAAAKSALEDYDLVGAFEEFEDFVHVLCCEAGWPAIERIPRANVTQQRARVEEIDARTRSRLEQMNELDMALYEHALAMFRRKRHDVLRSFAATKAGSDGLDGGGQRPLASKRAEVASAVTSASLAALPIEFGSRRIEILSATVTGDVSRGISVFAGEVVNIRLALRAHEPADQLVVGFRIVDDAGRIVYGTNSRAQGKLLAMRDAGDCTIEFRLRCDIGYGDYAISASVHSAAVNGEVFHWRDQAAWIGIVANIGDHWEGAFKLYPQITCASQRPGSAELVDASGWQRSQYLTAHAPVLTEFRGSAEPIGAVSPFQANEVRAIEVRATNTSTQTWPSTGLQRVCVSYRWLADDGTILVYDGERTPLPCDVPPGETIRLWAVVKAPPDVGEVMLSCTLLQEYVAWFDEVGAAPTQRRVRIVSPSREEIA